MRFRATRRIWRRLERPDLGTLIVGKIEMEATPPKNPTATGDLEFSTRVNECIGGFSVNREVLLASENLSNHRCADQAIVAVTLPSRRLTAPAA